MIPLATDTAEYKRDNCEQRLGIMAALKDREDSLVERLAMAQMRLDRGTLFRDEQDGLIEELKQFLADVYSFRKAA